MQAALSKSQRLTGVPLAQLENRAPSAGGYSSGVPGKTEPASRLLGGDVNFVVAIDAIDHIGDEPRDDEDTNDHVAENAKVIIQGSDDAPKATAMSSRADRRSG